MKIRFNTLFLLFLIPILLSRCVTINAKFFSTIKQSNDPNYGYTPEDPITIKNADLDHSINSCYYYLSRLGTSDDHKLLLIQRFTVDNPNYKKPIINLENRYTGQPLSSGTGPLLDLYILKSEGKPDTIKIYMNPYLKGSVKIPTGLKFER